MTSVVQLTCPHCKKALRIPADWIGQAMRCKFCQNHFQARVKTPQANGVVSAPVASAPAVLAVGNPSPGYSSASGDPFSFGEESSSPATIQPSVSFPRRSKKSGWRKKIILGLCGLALVAGAFAFGPQIKNLVNPDKPSDGLEKIAKGPDKGKIPGEKPNPDKGNGSTDKIVETPAIEKGPPKKGVVVAEKDPPPNKKGKPDPGKKVSTVKKGGAGEVFPRRALLINVNNYLYFNPLGYGGQNASISSLARQLTLPPFKMPANQVVELSDGSPSGAHSTLKSVIMTTISDFLDSSREQDRIMLFFAGHAVVLDKEVPEKEGAKEKEKGDKDDKEAKVEQIAYLVPLEGDLKDQKTLIPLRWVYDQLARCKARQKVFIVDVCRFPQDRGFELPGGGAGAPNYELSDELDTILQQPPAGVQVWSACIKNQQSLEFSGGGFFVEALCRSARDGLPGIQEPTHSLPVEALLPKVNQFMKDLLDRQNPKKAEKADKEEIQRIEQMSRLAGKEPDSGAAYDAKEPPPAQVTLKPPTLPGGSAAGRAIVANILEELNLIPPVRSSQNSKLDPERMPAFATPDLEPYKSEYRTISEMRKMIEAKPEQYPLRVAVLKAAKAMEVSHKIVMEERLQGSPGATLIDPKLKNGFLLKQQEPGKMIYELEQILADLKEAGEKRDEETSKRWQANYDYCLARLQARLVFIFEYNFILAQIRSDSLPALEQVHNSWRVGSRQTVQISEGKVKGMVKDIKKAWERITKDHPGTPWAVLARREQLSALGLEWRPSRD